MTQSQLDRSVARATGESVDFVRRFGFTEMVMPTIELDPPAASQYLLQTRNARRLPNDEDEPVRKAA